MSYSSVVDHRSMALDTRRNEAYAAVMQRVITPETVVLDLGAGTGVLGLIAARLGARRVYLVEPEDVVVLAEEIARANGLHDRVTVLRGRAEDLDVPERVDLLVSVMTGNFLVTEDLLPVLFAARSRWLKPGGIMLPSAAAMEIVPVSAPALHAREVAAWSTPQAGVDLSAVRAYAANALIYRADDVRNTRHLAEPTTIVTMDLQGATDDHVHTEVGVEVTRAGLCHGWVGWFRMQLGDEWLSTSPREQPLHWSPAFLPLDPPVALTRGERVTLTLDRPSRGDWTWAMTTATGAQRHSTLLAAPIAPDTLKRASLEYAPSLSDEGRIAIEILSRCDGKMNVGALADWLSRAYPDRYGDRKEAVRFVQRVIRRVTL